MGVNYIEALFDQLEGLFATVSDVHLKAFVLEHSLHHGVIHSIVIDHKHRRKLLAVVWNFRRTFNHSKRRILVNLTNDGITARFV